MEKAPDSTSDHYKAQDSNNVREDNGAHCQPPCCPSLRHRTSSARSILYLRRLTARRSVATPFCQAEPRERRAVSILAGRAGPRQCPLVRGHTLRCTEMLGSRGRRIVRDTKGQR